MSLKDEWYIACASHELKHEPLKARIFSNNYVLWRDDKGVAHAAIDRCAHRNAPLSAGEVHDGCVVCPYHGWKYNELGDCVEIPSLSSNSTVPSRASVPVFSTCELDDYVWLCSGEKPAELPRRFPHYKEKGWSSFTMKTRFESHVEACLENFLDCPHTATVHKGWFRNPDAREMDAVVRKGRDFVEVEFLNEPVTNSIIAKMFYPKGRSPKHTDRFLMPNISRVDYEFDESHHFIITSQATPVDDMITDVHTVITFCYGKWNWLVKLFFEPISRLIIRQDVDILKLHGDNLKEFGDEKNTYVETDLIALHIQSLRRQRERGEVADHNTQEKRIRIRF